MDVHYRSVWLAHLQAWSDAWPLEFSWIHDGKIDDVVFKVLAILPMTGLPPSESFQNCMAEQWKVEGNCTGRASVMRTGESFGVCVSDASGLCRESGSSGVPSARSLSPPDGLMAAAHDNPKSC
jgi:hypothetical protein